MSASTLHLAARRGTSICRSCLACRQSLLRLRATERGFATSSLLRSSATSAATRSPDAPPPEAAPRFQAYPLNPRPRSAPRNAVVPDSSIAKPVEVEVEGGEVLPRVNETRPPKESEGERRNGRKEGKETGTVSVPETEAQVSRPEFTHPASGAGGATEQAVPRKRQDTISFEPPRAASNTASTTSTSTSTTEPAPPKRSRLRTPRKAALRLTPTAVSQLTALLSQPDPKLIRVGVRNRGCSGLAYHLEYVDKPGAFDETVEQDGVKVLIDSKALFSIIGSEMDWVEDRLSERFVFRNPNIKEQCGCGESFMV